VVREPKQLKRLFHFELIDVIIAMGIASLVNGAMLIMAASTFNSQGITSVGTIEQAYRTLQPLLGKASSWVFALSLLASGLSSASVGTMAGQIIMQGFIKIEIPVWIRRLVTMIPSLLVIFLGLDPTRTLVISQVALSFGLPFAIIPLVMFTSRRSLMGVLTNHRFTSLLAWMSAGLIVALNIYLLYAIFAGG
jgi:manganese transport protein